MNELNFKIKIIDSFLNEQDYNDLCNLKLDNNLKNDFKVYHNEINNNGIIKCSIDENLLKRLHNNYFSNAIEILNEINPKKTKLYEYSDFSIIITNKNSNFPIHDDTPNKLLSGVIYLYPNKNSGTIFYNDKNGSNKTIVDWKPNRGVFFSRLEQKTWHSYQGDGVNNRIALVYNLNTNKIKKVYEIEKKNYFFGNFRFKINPYLFKYFKKTI